MRLALKTTESPLGRLKLVASDCSRHEKYALPERRLGSLACHTLWGDEELWTAGETARETSRDTSCRRCKRKKPSIGHCSLPSRHWIVRKTHGLRGRTRSESPFAQPGAVAVFVVPNTFGWPSPLSDNHGRGAKY
jgi:hypothetical protein